jgi:hypothetical protein
MRPPEREQDDCLEEGRLAGRIGAPDELRPGTQIEVQRAIAPEVPNGKRSKECRRSPP